MAGCSGSAAREVREKKRRDDDREAERVAASSFCLNAGRGALAVSFLLIDDAHNI